MGAIVGIDLGTSNSVVAWEDELGKVKVLSDRDGTHVHPSVVTFVDGRVIGGVLVGAAAKARKVVDPKNTVYSFKRLMGQTASSLAVRQARTRVPFEIRGEGDEMPTIHTHAGAYSAVELSAILLDHLREVAIHNIGRPIAHAVITVPANFNDAQRSATASAGAIAGLEVVRVLNEPTAAALAYGNTRRLNEIIAVYDFGGGTFDLTVMKLEEQTYTVLGTAGDSFLGGDDIDERIVDHMLARIVRDHRTDLRGDVIAMMKLRAAAELLKIELSTRPRASITIPDLIYDKKGRSLPIELVLTHNELVGMISDLVDRTMSVTRDALSVAQVKMERVADVILVGGTTRIPYIRNRVGTFFAKAARTDVSPDDAVAIGAALQASSLEQILVRAPAKPLGVPFNAPERTAPEPHFDLLDAPGAADGLVLELDPLDEPLGELPSPSRSPSARGTPPPMPAQVMPAPERRIIDVTPSSFGVGTLGGYCETLIWRSSPLPVTIKKRYATVRDDQDTVRIVVCQGETRRLTENVVLGDVVLGALPPRPRGTIEIEVAFVLDTNGMLQVSACDAETGQSRQVELDLVGRMDANEVAIARDRVQKLRR